MPEEPVTLDELERLLLRITGTSAETLEQQILSRLQEQTFVGGKRVARQKLPELPEDVRTTVHRVKVSLHGAKPPQDRDPQVVIAALADVGREALVDPAAAAHPPSFRPGHLTGTRR